MEDLANPEVVVFNFCCHADMRDTLQTCYSILLGEAPGTKCARGQSAESDLDRQSETPTGAGSLLARAGESLA